MPDPTAVKGEARSIADTRAVGLGASAGGLVALEQFLQHVPAGSGMAYIVVQHLDPTQKAMLPELLQRVTTMPVAQARQGQSIQPDHVYVIPPNTELSLAGSRLKLSNPLEPRGMRLPINVLFSSLASAQGERAIAVVLSGMGSDGTLGLQAIKALGGLGVVQDPASAQFDAMPRSAIDAGCGDIVAPPAELPGRIMAYVARVPDPGAETVDKPHHAEPAPEPIQRIVEYLQRRTRHDFSLYKASTLHRRIERRMSIHGIASAAAYADYLAQNDQEIDLLFKELLIGVTSFFRDAGAWMALRDIALPELLSQRMAEPNLRAWVVGCSTGEEAYSLAMVFREAVAWLPDAPGFNLQIFASDLSPDAIATARRGRYPLSIWEDVSAERLERHFTAHEDYYQINPSIREMVLFAQHDVVLDPPFTRLDLIVCRNLLIYFDAKLQRRLIPLFHYSLRPGGLLLLGKSETVGRLTNLFAPVDSKLRLYRRQNDIAIGAHDPLLESLPPLSGTYKERPVSSSPNPPSEITDTLQAAADQVLLQVYAPAAVVLNQDADIVYISGRTGKYLEPAAGKANWNLHAMAREGLRAPLARALKQAAKQSEPVHLHDLRVSTSAGVQPVDVTVQTFREPAALQGMTMVVFRDLPATDVGGRGGGKGGRSAAHQREIQQYQDEIETLREEARASREELQSSNEELQSTNEELQSTNEELTTSKEEMQSMNEELQTINSELHAKLDDLALAQSDMQNLLNSIDIAILFLDQELNVRRYTERAAKVFSLRENDVGRPLSDLNTSLRYPELWQDARETLRTLAVNEKQIRTTDERWFSVRIMPYRRLDNVIDGIVITMVDITDTKRLESALRQES